MDVFAKRADMANTLEAATKRALHEMLNTITLDRLLLLEVVAGGRFNWRKHLFKVLNGFLVNDEVANLMFARFEEVVVLHSPWPDLPAKDAAFKELDAYVPPPAPPTEEEIDKAWVHEIGSSEEAMRQMYEGSARTRKGTLH